MKNLGVTHLTDALHRHFYYEEDPAEADRQRDKSSDSETASSLSGKGCYDRRGFT